MLKTQSTQTKHTEHMFTNNTSTVPEFQKVVVSNEIIRHMK
jgi:hypothetical protein